MSQIVRRIKSAVKLIKIKSGESTSSKKVQSWTVRDSRPSRNQNMTNAYVNNSRIATGTFTGLIALVGLYSGCILYNVQDTSALTVSIDNSNLALNIPTKTTTGDFIESNNTTITVDSDSGYTLSMALADESSTTNLVSGNNKIESISSNLSKTDFSKESNTNYNNKWGYKPSQYVTGDIEGDYNVIDNTGDNGVFKPLPGANGEILDYKDSSDGENTYTLSIGARVNLDTPLGEYTSDAFIIAAVPNIEYLQVTYDANGGYFGDNTTKTTNLVSYDALVVPTTKYSHTPNISDDGVRDGDYEKSYAMNDVVTIEGADSLHIKLTYGSVPKTSAYLVFWEGNYPTYAAANYKLGVQNCGDVTSTNGRYASADIPTAECDVSGDSVTFYFRSTTKDIENGYGYYAVITSSIYSKIVSSGTYIVPKANASNMEFRGWSEDPNATVPTYTTESDISTKLQKTNADKTTTLYAVWGIPLYDTIENNWAAEGSRVQTNDDDAVTGIKTEITTSNSGIFKYDAEVFGEASDANNDKAIYYYRGILDQTPVDSGNVGDDITHPNTVLLDADKNGADANDSCWRIMRTTGSGGVKMIYSGKWTGSTCANAISHTSDINPDLTYSSPMSPFDATATSSGSDHSVVSVGYTYNAKYKTTTASTSSDLLFGSNTNYSGNSTNSSVKTYIEDTWFANNMTAYESMLEPSAGYCNDRSVDNSTSPITVQYPFHNTSVSLNLFYFSSYIRSNYGYNILTLNCVRNVVDLYTTNAATNGNKQLSKPAALPTTDELAFAGSGNAGTAVSKQAYLYSGGVEFLTLSPSYRAYNADSIFIAGYNTRGALAMSSTRSDHAVRPVVSLKNFNAYAISGTGTAADPWVVVPQ